MSPSGNEAAGQLLRSRGLRSTPQRRAILATFHGGASEHLSADEVFVRAAQSLPELSRATVYATLAEFAESGLLAAFGVPDPVRYEINTDRHAHFRCVVCARIFDLDFEPPDPRSIKQSGFRAERIDVQAEGVCAECRRYHGGLRAGTQAIGRSQRQEGALGASGVAAIEVDSPLGSLLLAATPEGLFRMAFPEHADADRLRSLIARSSGDPASHRHLSEAAEALRSYFGARSVWRECAIDWSLINGARALQATLEIPYGDQRSYSDLGVEESAHHLGYVLGSNPIPIFTPCHRVTRGMETPTRYVGGSERRSWLLEHERQHATAAGR